MTKIHLKVVGPMSEVPFEHPRTFKIGSRLTNKIKKVGRKWIRSTKSVRNNHPSNSDR